MWSSQVAAAAKLADLDAKITVQADVVADLGKQIADLGAARSVEAPAVSNLRTAAAINAQATAQATAEKLRAADDERRQAKRKDLADKLAVEAKTLAGLRTEKAKVEGDRQIAQADLGPIRSLAELVDADPEIILRGVTSVLALVLDPLAVLMLFAATKREGT
jgi:hypothetical protein